MPTIVEPISFLVRVIGSSTNNRKRRFNKFWHFFGSSFVSCYQGGAGAICNCRDTRALQLQNLINCFHRVINRSGEMFQRVVKDLEILFAEEAEDHSLQAIFLLQEP